MMIPRAIIAPLVGGVIGYITNDLAIRMLFRPRKAVYVGKFHVPFTPGLIPSQQGRIAQSIGGVISSQLLNEDTLRQTLLSEGTVGILRAKVRTALRVLSKDERSVSDLLRQPPIREKVNMSVDEIQEKLTVALTARIIDAKLGYAVVDSAVGNSMDFITQNKLFAKLVDEKAQEGIRSMLAEKVNDIISDKAPDISKAIVERFRAELMEARLCNLYAKHQDKEDTFVDSAAELYTTVLGDNIGKLLEAINIERIVVEKINSLDAAQLETMIFDIMKRELKAIVYLGALLGFIMGFVNLLF